MSITFQSFLEKYIEITPVEWGLLNLRFKTKHYKEGEIIYYAGDIQQELAFVVNGVLRAYMIDDKGKEFTWHIFYNDAYSKFANYFPMDYDSLIHQRPSMITIEVVKACELITMKYKDILFLFNQFNKGNLLGRLFAQEAYGTAHQYMLSYLCDPAHVRYEKFMQERSDWFDKIPQHQIATHLGITPQSLSRLKSKPS